jgi:hypothetical protein
MQSSKYVLDPEFWDVKEKSADPDIIGSFRNMVDQAFLIPTPVGPQATDTKIAYFKK